MTRLTDSAVFEKVAERFPSQRDTARRLTRVIEDSPPTVAVLGKYNHGKSSLLNVLIGEPCFAVSDKRETRKNQIAKRAGLCWIDTPGLDADSAGEDDRKAIEAATRDADLRLFVHAIDQGELDRGEAQLIAQLEREQAEAGRAFLLVLTRVDKIPSGDRDTVVGAIRRQSPQAKVVAVSAHAWTRGRDESKPSLQTLGNIPTLQSEVQQSVALAFAARGAERKRLAAMIAAPVDQALSRAKRELADLRASRERNLEHLVSQISWQAIMLNLELMADSN